MTAQRVLLVLDSNCMPRKERGWRWMVIGLTQDSCSPKLNLAWDTDANASRCSCRMTDVERWVVHYLLSICHHPNRTRREIPSSYSDIFRRFIAESLNCNRHVRYLPYFFYCQVLISFKQKFIHVIISILSISWGFFIWIIHFRDFSLSGFSLSYSDCGRGQWRFLLT